MILAGDLSGHHPPPPPFLDFIVKKEEYSSSEIIYLYQVRENGAFSV